MLNFIIYEDSTSMREIYERVIHGFMGVPKDSYRILPFSRFDKNTKKQLETVDGRKIYILDMDVEGKSGIDLARDIRKKGDWISQIIVISAFEHFKYDVFTSKLLALDFISKQEDIVFRLKEALTCAYEITMTNQTFSFQMDGEIYHVPYHDILFFSKDLNENSTSLITHHHTFKVKKSIIEIEKMLDHDVRFFKTHQSCIVNLHKIVSIDTESSTIYFETVCTNLLARNKKKALKERLTSC